MKTGRLIKTWRERYNGRRHWIVNAYRIVSPETGEDMVQPWSNTKKEARALAEALGIKLVEDKT